MEKITKATIINDQGTAEMVLDSATGKYCIIINGEHGGSWCFDRAAVDKNIASARTKGWKVIVE